MSSKVVLRLRPESLPENVEDQLFQLCRLLGTTDICSSEIESFLNNNKSVCVHINRHSYNYSSTPLNTAIGNDRLDLVRLLIRYGADPILKVHHNPTPLQEAYCCGSVACLRFLVDTYELDQDLNLECLHPDQCGQCCPLVRSFGGFFISYHFTLGYVHVCLYLFQKGALFLDRDRYKNLQERFRCDSKENQFQLIERTMIRLVLASALTIKRLGKKSMFSAYMNMDLVKRLAPFI